MSNSLTRADAPASGSAHASCAGDRTTLAIARQQPLEARVQRGLDLRLALQPRQQHGCRFDGRESVAARLAPQLAVARGPFRPKHDALALEHPAIAPPQRLGLAPGAVEQDDALDFAQRRVLVIDRVAALVHHHDIAFRQDRLGLHRTEIEDRPALRIGRAAEYLGEARPGQSDLEQCVLEVQRREPRGAELAILLLRVLQDQQRYLVVDWRDALAHAQGPRLEAARTFRVRIGWGRWRGPGGQFAHRGRIRPEPRRNNALRRPSNPNRWT